jgi:hypothetical protein
LKWGAPFPNSIARFARGWKPSAGDSAICIFAQFHFRLYRVRMIDGIPLQQGSKKM